MNRLDKVLGEACGNGNMVLKDTIALSACVHFVANTSDENRRIFAQIYGATTLRMVDNLAKEE